MTETFAPLPINTNHPQNTSTVEANAWIGIGPWISIHALVINPLTPTIIYVGTDSGIFKSVNSGQEWIGMNSGLPDGDILDMVIDPVTPTILYATTAGGVFKSTNAGETWNADNNGLPNEQVSKLAIDPITPATLYVITFFDGVFKSTNSAGSWSAINRGLDDGDPAVVLAVDPMLPNTLYLGTYSGGVFKSINGGQRWNAVNEGLALDTPNENSIDEIAIDPSKPTTLYAITRYKGIFKSINGGQHWAAFDTGLPMNEASNSTLLIDPLTPTTLYIGTSSGQLFKSMDDGKSWQVFDNTDINSTDFISVLAVNPLNTTILYVGTNAGVFTNQADILFAAVPMPALSEAPFAPTESPMVAVPAPTENASSSPGETLSVSSTLAPLAAPFSVTGSLNYRKETQIPENARLLVLWSVTADYPDYTYLFGEGTIDVGTGSFQLVFDGPPPSEALNWMGSSALGVGVVIITTDQTLQFGKMLPDALSTADILGASGQYSIIYVNNGFEMGEYIPWFNEFNPGYSIGKGVDIPDNVIDEFEPIDLRTFEIIIDDFEKIKFVNWT